MGEPENPLVPAARGGAEIILPAGIDVMLAQIRPQWKAKNLIGRVHRLLDVDPSSACQRLFNAAVHDLREKIVVAGLDVAGEAARLHKLPTIEKPEDVERLSVSRVIELTYRMGLLTRPQWRRLLRVYDIRRDLEHEDDEYEAEVEDCFYVFKTCIDVVLAKDPITVLRVEEVKDAIEEPVPVTPSAVLRDDFQGAPQPRQIEILQLLVSYALDDEKPEIIRQNSYNMLGVLRPLAGKQVVLKIAEKFMERLGRRTADLAEVRVAFTAGALPYLKRATRHDFFTAYLENMKSTGHSFKSHSEHGELLRNLKELGGLDHCPNGLLKGFVEWLVLCYIGEPGGYGMGTNRKVFFSNIGAPIALSILKASSERIGEIVVKLRKSSREIRSECENDHVERRYQTILDHVS